MSGTGRCYDNARMESFFATLKKEKLYKIKTELLPMETVKTIIFRYVEIYYNRNRVYTTNIGGYPPLVYRQMYYCNLQKTA
jgi:putative transposase